MNNTLKIYCKNINEYIAITGGETLQEIFLRISDKINLAPICAKVNNRTEDLAFPVYSPKQIEFIDSTSASGNRVYTRSLCMILYKAVEDVAKGLHLRIEHSISKGHYCRLINPNNGIAENVTDELVSEIKCRMNEIVNADIPFVRKEKLTTDVIEIFKRQNLNDKVQLLETGHNLYTVYYRLDNLCDCYYGPLAPSTACIKAFDLQQYKEGFLLLGHSNDNPKVAQSPIKQEKMFGAFTDYLSFNRILGISNVGELNRAVADKMTPSLINVAEALHDKQLGRISDEIARRRQLGEAKIVLIAGPSSSGKTTTTKRLAIQLMTNLIVPKMISLDDYFVNREDTPRDETGDYDYESLYSLDLELFNSDMNKLLSGEEINLPTYSFELGRRIEKHRPLRLGEHEVLIIEGIHGLNPELTAQIPDKDKFKLYVSALTTLSIDDHNWIPTTDNRLLRRIVRDYKYRATSALSTMRRWPSVRRGEEKWIFPFQENADAMFNSSLLSELGVMKRYAEPVLRQVPHDVPEYAEAYRLLKFLSYFEPIPADQIPSTSLLREFLGGSSFTY